MDLTQECGPTQAWDGAEKNMVEGQGSQVMVVKTMPLSMGMERQAMIRVCGQVLLRGRRNEVLSVTGQGVRIEGIVMRESMIGTGMTGITGTGKKRIVIGNIVTRSVTQVMKMIMTGDNLRDPGAGHEQFQKNITGLDQGMQIMGSGGACHQSDVIRWFLFL